MCPTQTLALVLLLACSGGQLRAQLITDWPSGNIPIAGVASGDTLNITTGNNHDFPAVAWANAGIVNWSGGALRSGSSGSITNNAAFNDTASNIANNDFGGAPWFFQNTSTGTYTKSAAGTTTFSVAFNNSGTVAVTTGTLSLQGGGTLSGGTLSASNNAIIALTSNYTLASTVTFSGAGIVQLTAGTLSGDATLEGPLTWIAGNMNSAGTYTFGSTSILTVTSANVHDFNGRALINNGTVNWSDGQIRSGNSGSITNNAAWNDTASNSLNNAYGGAPWTFTNASNGTYTKSAPGTTTFSMPFVNQGSVSVTAGTLLISAGGSSSGGLFSTGLGAFLDFSSGYSLGNTITFAGTGTARLTGGTLVGPATIEGPFTWTAGSFRALTFGTTAVLTINSAATHDFDNAAWTNNGIVNWTDGQIRSGNSGSITNNATWNDTASNALNNAFGGVPWAFNNSSTGIYHKAAVGTTTVSIPFLNQGVVSVTAGNLLISAGGTSTGGTFTTGSQAGINFSNGYNISGTVTFAGPGVSQLTGGTLSGPGTIAGPFTWTNGIISAGSPPVFGSTSILTISGATQHDFNAAAWTNNGIVNWTDGQLRSGNSGSITNNATWNDTASNAANNAFGGAPWTFNNATNGTYNKSGAGTTTFTALFDNAGAINVTTGSLNLAVGGTATASGIFNTALNTSVEFSGGSYSIADASKLTGAGNFVHSGGSLTLAGQLNSLKYQQTGGTLFGSANIAGAMDWVAGNINSSGTLTVLNGGTLAASSANAHDFNGRALVNNGTFNWTDGQLRSGSGGTITNNAAFNDTASNNVNNAYGGTVLTFTNSATGNYTKSAAGITTFSVSFANAGTLDLRAGTMNFAQGLALQSTSKIDFSLAGNTRGITFGAVDVAGSLALDGLLGFSFSGGEESRLTGTDTFALLNLTSGTLSGAFTNVANGGRLVALDGLGSFQVNYGATSLFAANSVVLSNFLVPVPEPSTWALLGTGLLAVALTLRRRRTAR